MGRIEAGMFQPSMNENVYRSLQQRLDAIGRIVRNDASLDEFARALNLPREVTNNATSLWTELSPELWDRINGYRARLEQSIAEGIASSENTQRPSLSTGEGDNDENIPELSSNTRGEVGRPKKCIEKDKLRSLLNIGFTVS